MMFSMDRSILAHHLNSAHVYCRILAIGVKKERALMLSRVYEKVLHPILYAGYLAKDKDQRVNH
jgi:hypothetical protein